MYNKLIYKTYLVAGGSKGIGQSTASLLAKEDAQVITVSRSKSGSGKNIQMDLYLFENIDKLADLLTKTHPDGLHGLVYTLGTYLYDETDPDQVNLLWHTHIVCLDRLLRNLKTLLTNASVKTGQTSSVVVIASIDGVRGGNCGRNPLYAAAKGAQESYLRRMAIQVAPYIRINWINSGFVVSDFTPWNRDYQSNKEFKAMIDQKTLLKRAGTPKDLAYLVLFLLNHTKSGWITGAGFTVDGGVSAQ